MQEYLNNGDEFLLSLSNPIAKILETEVPQISSLGRVEHLKVSSYFTPALFSASTSTSVLVSLLLLCELVVVMLHFRLFIPFRCSLMIFGKNSFQ